MLVLKDNDSILRGMKVILYERASKESGMKIGQLIYHSVKEGVYGEIEW